MATRYYLSNSAAAAASPAFDSNWNDTINWAAANRRAMATAKSNSTLTAQGSNDFGTGTICSNGTAPGRILMRQWVGPQIGVFNFNTTTVSLVLKAVASGTITSVLLNLGVRLLHLDGSLTSLLAVTAANYDTNFPTTAATRIVNAAALSNITSQNKDRLVVEVGANWTTVGSQCRTVSLTDGDVSATADYALTSGLTTSLDPWVEFSGTLPAPVLYDTGQGFLTFFH